MPGRPLEHGAEQHFGFNQRYTSSRFPGREHPRRRYGRSSSRWRPGRSDDSLRPAVAAVERGPWRTVAAVERHVVPASGVVVDTP
ncbi:hypothetical protein LNP17_25585 [Klebsiella variicola subsp. variicola]|nr:hypothetical protein [Klebsiella variicola subsp. variicola]